MENKCTRLGVRKKAYELAEREIGVAAIDQLDGILSAQCQDPTERGRALLKVIERDKTRSETILCYIMAFYGVVPWGSHEIAEVRLTRTQLHRYRHELGEFFDSARKSIISYRADLAKTTKSFWSLISDHAEENARVFLLTELIESDLVPFTEFVDRVLISNRKWEETYGRYKSQLAEIKYTLASHQAGWTDMSGAVLAYLDQVPNEDRVVFLGCCINLAVKIRGGQIGSQLVQLLRNAE